MKTKILSLATVSLISFRVSAVSTINCVLTERYNDQKLETPVQVSVEKGVAFFQKTSARDPQIQMVVYYSQEMSVLGVRVNDYNSDTTSSSYSDPAQENGPAKVRHIRNKPEAQLFAVDCTWK